MFYMQDSRMLNHQTEGSDAPQVPLHNIDENNDLARSPEGSGAANTPRRAADGTWGERDLGGAVDFLEATEEFEELRRELSYISRTRSKGALTHKSSRRSNAPTDVKSQSLGRLAAEEVDDDDFELGAFLKDGHFEKRKDEASTKKIGVVYKHLTVQGVGATATFVKTLPEAVLGTFGPDLYRFCSKFIPSLPMPGENTARRCLINDFSGMVRNGEMLLVLGRPGSGCTSFLKAISNQRGSFAEVTGHVQYGGIDAKEQMKSYRGEVAYNEEDDQHFPTLTVEQTLKFSLLNKTKKREKSNIPIIIGGLLKMFRITHTRHTLVGDAFIRGVSGGERKRISIAETLATRSTVVAWDNSTRGLDASTALDYANSLRVMTDVSDRTTFVTLYQAGEGIYELMDKVLVIDEGRMVYSGPANTAKAYFQTLGYYCPHRMTTADFLTACTDPNERRFRQDFEGPIPKGAIELEQAFRNSEDYQKVLQDIESYEEELRESDHANTLEFKNAVQEGKSTNVSSRSPYTVSFISQVIACTRREIWLTLGDRETLYTNFFIIISIALIVGSLFRSTSFATDTAYSRGGIVFFSIVFPGWLQLPELEKAIHGRTILKRHLEYAFYRPSAVVISRVVQDLIKILIQVVTFSIIMYFVSGLDVEPGKFFIYVLFIYVTTVCITSLYRMFAAFCPTIDDGIRFSGTALNLLIVYTGYMIPKTQLLSKYIWFGWLYYVNPIAYSFEAVLTNELSDRTMACAENMVVPRGAGFNNPAYQACSLPGGKLGSLNISGADYLNTSLQYTRSNLWRNLGVVLAFSILYIVITVVASELFDFTSEGGGVLEFKGSKRSKRVVKAAESLDDEEKSSKKTAPTISPRSVSSDATPINANLGSDSVFTWRDVEYTVPYLGGEKKLLNKVSGFAKPGVMTALMGASGAGKTTLLNTLAQRQTTGVTSGDMLVNGCPLGLEFQRGTGFCEQRDLHDGSATVREALEFSAILRQDRSIPRAEKIAYVDKIIDLLELVDIQDALIRCLGVEQKKRVTIGVELAAKPNLLLFLDEPTSGLDSQSAYSIISFLKKLAEAGQAIVCTIHQPSSILIQQFDSIVALNPGGNVIYSGPVGENGKDVVKYFGDRGVQCPPEKNVAEFILETAAKRPRGRDGKRVNWNDEWLISSNKKEIDDEISRICNERSDIKKPSAQTQHQFASPVWLQTTELTKRTFTNYWRDPSYLYGKLFVAAMIGIFNGFTFWQLGNSIIDLQNRMFSTFIILLIPPTIVNAVVPKFYQARALWETRELPSRIYGWVAFCTANIVTEIPIAIIGATIYWALWYWPSGQPSDSETAGYVYLMILLFFLFQASWGQWICAFAPSLTVISNILPFFFVVASCFNGVFMPYNQLSVFWRYWLYWANPATYFINGIAAATLKSVTVECAQNEAVYFNPSPGLTCSSYADSFIAQYGGYLTNPTATSGCGYCKYRDGAEYMTTLNLEIKDQWKYMGVFFAFCISNWALVYFFIYTVRIKGWTFGVEPLFNGFGRAIGFLRKLFYQKSHGKEMET